MKTVKVWQIVTLVVVLLGSGAGVYGWRSSVITAKAEALPANTQLVAAQLGNVVNAVSASGTLSFPNSSDLNFGSAGTVQKVDVRVGDSVKKGQSLAAIDTLDLQRAVTQATLNIKTAQTNLSNTQTLYTKEDLDKAKAALTLANAVLDKAVTALQTGGTPDPLVVAVKTAAVESAQKALDLALTPDPLVITARQNAVATAQNNLQIAQDALATLQAGATTAELARANATLLQAQAAYATATAAAVADPTNAVKQAAVQVALVNYQAAQDALVDLVAGPTASELARAQLAVSQAQLTVNQAQQDLTNARTQDTLLVAQKRLALSQAQEDLVNAKAVDPVMLAQLQFDVANARVGVNQAQKNFDTIKAGPDPDEIALKQFQYDSAKAALDDAKEALANASLPAPFDGVVSAVNVKVGQNVSAATVVVSMVDTTTPQIDAQVTEIDISKVKVGMRATISLDGLPGVAVSGTVSSVSVVGKTTSGVVSYPITIQAAPPPGAQVRGGMSATATMVVQQANNVLVIPNRAVGGTTRNPSVTVVTNGKNQAVPVTLGLSDDSRTQVLSGLNPGDQVLVSTGSSSQQRFFGGSPGAPQIIRVAPGGR